MSLETAQKIIVPQKKNYVPHFLKQRDINSYFPCTIKMRNLNIKQEDLKFVILLRVVVCAFVRLTKNKKI
jgi:hypothetical protein